jgi:hypothetical protein
MSDLGPFAFSIGPDGGTGWRWRAAHPDGRVAEGRSATRAAAAACVIRVLAGGSAQSGLANSCSGGPAAGS